MSSISGSLWWVSPLQGSDWIDFRKFILDKEVIAISGLLLMLLRWDPSLGQSIILAMTLVRNKNFPLKLLKLHQNNELNFTEENIT